jgi:hypothetical protein
MFALPIHLSLSRVWPYAVLVTKAVIDPASNYVHLIRLIIRRIDNGMA